MKLNATQLQSLIAGMTPDNSNGVETFVEQDKSSPVPKLVLKAGVLEGDLPDGFDVDVEIFKAFKAWDAPHYPAPANDAFTVNLASVTAQRKVRVMAEGDSWFSHHPLYGNKSIATQMIRRSEFDMVSHAYWGDTLENIFRQKQYLRQIETYDFLLLSGGGNDFNSGLDRYLYDYDHRRPFTQYLTPEGERALQKIIATYRSMIAEVQQRAPHIKIVVHGYDYFRPQPYDVDDPFNGLSQFMGWKLSRKGFSASAMTSLVKALVDRLNHEMAKLSNPRVQYLDCRNITKDDPWTDDIHPDFTGFSRLADHFTAYIRQASRNLQLAEAA